MVLRSLKIVDVVRRIVAAEMNVRERPVTVGVRMAHTRRWLRIVSVEMSARGLTATAVAQGAQTRQLLRQLVWGRETADADRLLIALRGESVVVDAVEVVLQKLLKKQPEDVRDHTDQLNV